MKEFNNTEKALSTSSPSYMVFNITEDNLGQILNIMDNVIKENGTKLSLSFTEYAHDSVLTVKPSIWSKKKIFDIINSSKNSSISFDRANPMVQELFRLHRVLRTFGYKYNRMNNNIEFKNGLFNKTLSIGHDIGYNDYLLDNKLSQFPFKNLGHSTFFLTSNNMSRLNNILSTFNKDFIFDLLAQDRPIIESDEFSDLTKKDPIVKNMYTLITENNAQNLLNYNFDINNLSSLMNHATDDLMKKLQFSGLNHLDIIMKYNGSNPLHTKLTKDQSFELVQNYFATMDIDFSELLQNGEYTNTDGQTTHFAMNNNILKNATSSPLYPRDDAYVSVMETGDLRDAYSLIRELSHTLYIKNGLTESKIILGEVIPLCMERMFDGYLMNLPQAEKDKFGFDDEILKTDIANRQISTYVDRFMVDKNVDDDNLLYQKSKDTRYMLAQIYSTQFMNFSEEEQRQKITECISAMNNNDIRDFNSIFNIKIDKPFSEERKQYVNDSISTFQNLLLSTHYSNTNQVTNEPSHDAELNNNKPSAIDPTDDFDI